MNCHISYIAVIAWPLDNLAQRVLLFAFADKR
jgi:hypothetical protein